MKHSLFSLSFLSSFSISFIPCIRVFLSLSFSALRMLVDGICFKVGMQPLKDSSSNRSHNSSSFLLDFLTVGFKRCLY